MILDWNEYQDLAIQAVAEGVVLLKNENQVLPLKKNARVAVYGRIQTNYYKSGTGSGGMVNVSKVTGILDALVESPLVHVDSQLLKTYQDWEKENPFNAGTGWGCEPFSQEEMPLAMETARSVASRTDTAIVIIGRSAGEDKDSKNEGGAYQLSQTELELLHTVRKAHSSMVVLLNVGSIMDMGWVKEVNPDALMYVWQGGMLGGYGICDVLTGKTCPSGKLPDTIAQTIQDYPSNSNFGGATKNIYAEDIYVGYRYFETFAKDKVLYPFGFGLSYTKFSIEPSNFTYDGKSVKMSVCVTNTGGCAGKEVVQIYIQAPQGKLGKPSRVLVAFEKTRELNQGESQILEFNVPRYTFASYDDGGATGNKSCYVLEKGLYTIHVGSSVRDTIAAGSFELTNTEVLQKLVQRLAPETSFKRLKPLHTETNSYKMDWEDVPLCTERETVRRLANLPKEIPQTKDRGIKLADVALGKASMQDFIAQLTDEDLACIIRGEGMGSPKVTPGTASAFGGVSEGLKELGIPCGCTTDGPSGMRLDSGVKAFSLPNGTLLASTFNQELSESLFSCTGKEMAVNKIDILLGPGINIHRHPLNGRNFEYFSEDPLLTGKMAAAQIRGMHKSNATGTLKHMCCNNQEFKRFESNSILSERALREIYLKGFEIAVKEAAADAIMTSYNPVNGIWAASRYDLNTGILREEWDFKGVVMTDWWAMMNDYDVPPARTNLAQMACAQNDMYMVCQNAATNSNGDNILESLANGRLARAELQRNAMNICSFLTKTRAFQKILKTEDVVEIINRPEEDSSSLPEDVVYYKIEDEFELAVENGVLPSGSNVVMAFEVEKQGIYEFSITASSTSSELSQLPVTLFTQGIPVNTFTWNGTGGKDVEITKEVYIRTRFTVVRLFSAQNGLNMKKVRLRFSREMPPMHFMPTDE